MRANAVMPRTNSLRNSVEDAIFVAMRGTSTKMKEGRRGDEGGGNWTSG